MLHRNNWLICPLHAAATMIMMRNSPFENDKRLFSHIIQGQESKHLNTIFDTLFDYWLTLDVETKQSVPFQHYTSRAIRHDAIYTISNDSNIAFATAAQRTGLMLASFNNIFKYLNGGFKNDSQCSRSYSDWSDVNAGGIIPG